MIKDTLIPFVGNNNILSLLNLLALNAIFLAIGVIVGLICKTLLLKAMQKSHKHLNLLFIESVLHSKLINLILPAFITILLGSYCQFLSNLDDEISTTYNAVSSSFFHALNFILATLAINRIITIVHYYYNKKYTLEHDNEINNYVKVVKVIVWSISIILYLSFLLNKSPLATITGIGAISAFFLLIFKDTFLGLMASVQSSVNNVAKIGDWVVIPVHNVNGTLISMSINTIKVLNWDNTISTLPTYVLTSTQIQNWQNVFESGGRRFIKNLHIDIESITNFEKDNADKLIHKYNINIDNLSLEDQTNNLLLFKSYVEDFLNNHAKVNHDMTVLTRLLDTNALGVVFQIYAFSNEVEWLAYEKVQSDIMARVLLTLKDFSLKVVQNSTVLDIG
jgi:miniconductance mechanosensitive channel